MADSLKILWRRTRYFMAAITLTALPSVLFAAEPVATCGSPGSIFAPTCQDKSIQYLTYIFGAVGNVLPTTALTNQESLLANMFSVFNSTALGLGAIIILYTLFVSTLRTAHEGETLGREWSSMWIPIRSALGISFLVPAKAVGGYSAIQLFMMWVTVQGIGAADNLWAMVLDKLPETSIATPPPPMNVSLAANDVFMSMVCMYALDKIEHPNATSPTYRPILKPMVPNAPKGIPVPYMYSFDAGKYDTACGSVTMLPGPQVPTAFSNLPQNATTTMINQMMPAAQAIVFSPNDVPDNSVTLASAAYSEMIRSTVEAYLKESKDTASEEAFRTAKAIGWIFAGSYYYDLARINDAITGFSTALMLPPATTSWDQARLISTTSFYPPNKLAVFAKYMKEGSDYITNRNVQPLRISSLLGAETTAKNDKVNKILKKFNDDMATVVEAFARGLSGSTGDVGSAGQINPIIAAQRFGATLLIAVQSVWILGTILIAAITLGLSAGSLFTTAAVTAIGTIVSWFATLLGPLLVMMFTAGAFLAFYVPLIPYILFTFGAIGWLGTVIEAMIAAPLVALGVIHPEGHAVYGKAEPAVMLILNIFLRPSLMIFGLIAAMIMSYVAVGMINFGFVFSLSALGVFGDGGATAAGGTIRGAISISMVGIVGIFAMMFIYSGLVVTAMQRTFALIHEIPVRVLRWIAGGREAASDYGEEQSAGQVKSGLDKGMETGASSASQAQREGATRARDRAVQKYQATKATKETGDESGGNNDEGKGPSNV